VGLPSTDTATSSLDLVRRQRAQLLAMIQRVESALAAPTAEPGWRGEVMTRLAALREGFAGHMAITEGAEGIDGLYAELLGHAPRLAHGVDGLVREHRRLRRALDAVWVRAAGARPQELRLWAGDLLRDLHRHRQRGADLVYEAYQTDIGGET
jgi:hypothetical protein